MFIALAITLLITGCASTKVVDHDFKSTINHLQNKYPVKFAEGQTAAVYPHPDKDQPGMEQAVVLLTNWLTCAQSIEVEAYEINEKLKLKYTTYGKVGKYTDEITVVPENPA